MGVLRQIVKDHMYAVDTGSDKYRPRGIVVLINIPVKFIGIFQQFNISICVCKSIQQLPDEKQIHLRQLQSNFKKNFGPNLRLGRQDVMMRTFQVSIRLMEKT